MKPSQGREVVGKKSAWELWAKSAIAKEERSKELLAMGCFTVGDFAAKSGWTDNKAKHFLKRQPLKYEIANDHRQYRNPQVRFYFPPK